MAKGAALPARPKGLPPGRALCLQLRWPMARNGNPPINEELLRILACPACHSPVELVDGPGLLCQGCGLKYPIRDGIPVMLVEEAHPPEGQARQ